MKRINRLRYMGVVAGMGLAVVLLGNGVYANPKESDVDEERTEAENWEEESGIEVVDFSDFAPPADSGRAAGAGRDIELENIDMETVGSESGEVQDAETENANR